MIDQNISAHHPSGYPPPQSRRPSGATGRRFRRSALALSLALLGVSAGCSGTTDTAAPTACAEVPGVTDTALRLGMVLSDTGPAASQVIGARAGAEARLRLQNAAGGVHGRQLVYDWRDDQSSPQWNLTAARELVEHGDIFSLISATSVAAGSADYLKEAGIPVAGLAMESVWTTHGNMVSYLNRIPSTVIFDTVGQFAKARGVKRAVILQTSTSLASQAGADRFEMILRNSGIDVAGRIDYTPAATTPTAVGRLIAHSGADALFAPTTADDFVDAFQGAKAAGANLKVALGVSGYGNELLARRGAAASGAHFYLAYLPFEAKTPAQQAYLDAIARYAPELDPPNAQAAVESYITTDLLIQGLRAAGTCPTREGLLDALRSISSFNGAGLLPAPVDLTQGFGQSARCLTFVQVNTQGTGYDVEQPSVCGNPIRTEG